jgi:hypothetical protein
VLTPSRFRKGEGNGGRSKTGEMMREKREVKDDDDQPTCA